MKVGGEGGGEKLTKMADIKWESVSEEAVLCF